MLQILWCEGVRVTKRPDGALALIPTEAVTDKVLQLARDSKPEIETRVQALPAPGRCPVCGAPNGWADIDGSDTAHCVTCTTIAVDRLLGIRKATDTRERNHGNVA